MNYPTAGVSLSFAANPRELQSLDAEELQKLLWAVARRPNVTSLSLQGNLLTMAAQELLCSFVQSLPAFRQLNVSMCGLGDQGSVALVRSICAKRSPQACMHKLDLSLNGVTSEGCAAIAKILGAAKRGSIRSIALRYSPIHCSGIAVLLQHGQLASLDCRYCRLAAQSSSRQFDELIRVLRLVSSVKTLILDGNAFAKSQCEHLRSAFTGSSGKVAALGKQIYLSKAAGAAPNVDALIDSIACSDTATTTAAVRALLIQKQKDGMLNALFDEIAKIEGPIVVVRQSSKPTAAPTTSHHRASSRSRTRDIVPAQVQCLGSRVATPALFEQQSSELEECRCQPPPVLLPAGTKGVSVLEANGPQHPNDDANEEEPYVPPLPVKIVPYCRSASAMSHRSAISDSRRSDFADDARKLANDTKALLRKGMLARMLLDRCMVDDEQAMKILNISVGAKTLLETNNGAELGIPPTLLPYTAVPSQLATHTMFSPSRVGGISKLLYCILHAPGERLPLDEIRRMHDLPKELRALPASSQSSYRSQRSAENNEARKQLAVALNIAPAPGSARMTGRARPARSRYLMNGAVPSLRAVSAQSRQS